MPANVEIKARVNDFEWLKNKAHSLSGQTGTTIKQEDIFFKVPKGRLKLRKLQDEKGQLIYYERSDQTGPKLSDYCITLVENPDSLEETLGKAIGILGRVKKTRLLYMVGQTRVHVDQVDQLGEFMELEVQMKEGQSVDEGQTIAESLMKQLGVENEDLITCAYMDLILQKGQDKGDIALGK